jgi:hypothetical protein
VPSAAAAMIRAMAASDDLAAHVEHEMAVARRRFRSRIASLALASIAVDLVAAGLAKGFEQGAQHSFPTYLDALFWTTTQLLTVSSQLPIPSARRRRSSTWSSRRGQSWSWRRSRPPSATSCTTARAITPCRSAKPASPDPNVR